MGDDDVGISNRKRKHLQHNGGDVLNLSHNGVNSSQTQPLDLESALFSIDFKTFGNITVSLPAFSLLFALVTACIFDYENIHEISCKVYNVVPSISAVTGITPQAYVWRVCIALHCTPRFMIAALYYNYYKRIINRIPADQQKFYLRLIKVNLILNVIENGCLCLVTYISNKENYPIHEKIFVVFMFSSLLYMLTNTYLYHWTRGNNWSDKEKQSFKLKSYFLIGILSATAGLLFFFYRHKRYCEPLAFSYFSICEYVIAYTNIGYHYSAMYEFGHLTLSFSRPLHLRQS